MSITRLFVRRVTLSFVFVTLTLIAGFISLRSLVVQELPNTSLPVVGITLAYSGASTSELRDTIARPIENALAGTQNLDHIDTVIQTGNVQITASFALGSSESVNLTNVQKALQAAQGELPSDLIAPTINTANPSESVVVTLAMTSKKYTPDQLAGLAQNQIVPVLEQVPGVSTVNVKGKTQAAYVVAADPALLAASNLTLTDLIDAIEPNNIRAPGGIVYGNGRETQVDIRGDITTPQSLAALPIHGVAATSQNASGTGGASLGGASATGNTGVANNAAGGEAQSNGSSALPNTANVQSAAENVAPDASASAVPTTQPSPTATNAASPSPAPSVALGSFNVSTGDTTTANSGSGTTSTSGTTAVTPTTSMQSQNAATAQTTSANLSAPSATTQMTGTSLNGTTNSANTTSVNADQALAVSAPQTTSANSAFTAAAPTTASVTSSGAAGTSLSPLVGTLGMWANQSTTKRVGDVASVRFGSTPMRVYAHENGTTGIGLDVKKASAASEVTVADSILAALPKLRSEFPDIDFAVEHIQATYTRQQLEGVEHSLFEGIVLTAFVMLFFLKSWRNALVVLVAIPTSLGVTLTAMHALNLTLDTISLLAMTLVIGILIDDSTVVLENGMRHLEAGEEPADAAVNGRNEIGVAAVVITLVDVIVFLPFAFIGGAVGKQLSEFGIVIAIATLTSLFVSFTVTPAMAGLWSMRSNWKPWPIIERFSEGFESMRHWYARRLLPNALKRPWSITLGSAVLCIAAIALIPLGIVGEEYIPQGDQGEIFVQVQFPNGTPLAKTKSVMFELERHVKPLIGHDLDAYETTAGVYDAPFGGPAQEGNVGQIHLWLTGDHTGSTATYVAGLQKIAARIASGASVVVKPASAQGGGPRQPIDVLVQTRGTEDPGPYAQKIAAALKATPGATAVGASSANVAPQVEVEFDRQAAQALDVSIGTAATAIRAALGGAQAAQIETAENGLTEIEVIYPRIDQTSLDAIRALPIRTQNGGIVHVEDFAVLKSAPASLLITRENRADVVHVSANIVPGYQLSNVVNDFHMQVAKLHLPAGVTYNAAPQGQQDLMRQTLSALSASLAFSMLFVFLMIVALYNSFRTPFVTLFAIPLATVGAVGALALTHQTLNLYSLIGTVLLVGLVTKNGILLVDFADMERTRGSSRETAIMNAAKERFRPVVMTTIAMAAGMLPLALGLDPGASQRASLGIVVIGGLMSSLVLTLLVVPIMYCRIAPKRMMQETKLASHA